MNLFKFTLPIISIIVLGCSASTEPDVNPAFNRLNIEYHKSGGWINAYSLFIDSTGLLKIYVNDYSSSKVYSDSNTTNLTTTEKKNLSNWFSDFNDFEKNYYPEIYSTDQNYYTIILRSGISMDTCSVYDPQHCKLPDDLHRIIGFMDGKIDELSE